MSNAATQGDLLERACALVGRFQYHFGRVEQKINEAVIKLLDLDEKAGQIVTGSVDFAKKVNLVRTSASQQLSDAKNKQFAEDTCNAVFDINTTRQNVIHAAFEPVGDSVQFRRTVAKDGRVRVLDDLWDANAFDAQWKKMKALEDALNSLILKIKPLPPMGWQNSFQDIYYPHPSAVALARALALSSENVEPPRPPND
jgi:hypothetical protein